MLSEVSQMKTNAAWHYSYAECRKYNKPVNLTKKMQAHRQKNKLGVVQTTWEER